MKAFIFFSVYEDLFHRVAMGLREYGVTSFGGFVWGKQQEERLRGQGIDYAPLVVFTRDLLPKADDGTPPDLEWLAMRERQLGFSVQRMLAAERHLLVGRTQDQIMRMAEVALRSIAAALDEYKPDFLFSEDISCFHSHVHFHLAKERNIPFWIIGAGRLPHTLSIYSMGFQHNERVEELYREIRARGLTDKERREAERFVTEFREKPQRPSGMEVRAKPVSIDRTDAPRFRRVVSSYLRDPKDPTLRSPLTVIGQRLRRMARVRVADALGLFERPVPGEKYVLYPIHFQPEATTLVQAPLYVDQLALLRDIAATLPVGVRLYVKEHSSNRGRRTIAFYQALRAIPSVRLLGPDEDTWALIRNASAIAVITGTMGWEGLFFGKPVVTFGDVFMNLLPHVYRAGAVAKDGWYDVFTRALSHHVDDHDALLALVSAFQQVAVPGRIHNPSTVPAVLEPENVQRIITALATAAIPQSRRKLAVTP